MEYGEEDNCLFGKVLGLKKDCITYKGEIISELKINFEGAILHGMAAVNVSPILTLQHVLLIKICKIENVFLIHSDYFSILLYRVVEDEVNPSSATLFISLIFSRF
ncbi:hypothetical protein [Bacteroides uniformis]|uniref:hypothetical protein n=1 Tax=Bacteroides uniformis TaxID=820 RepID=UPI001A9219A6|nr:hypothetical protein [Bacteroides uniformis]